MDREDQLIGEIIAARSVAQGLCYLLVANGVVPREAIENQLAGTVGYWAKASNGDDPKAALHAGIAAVRLTEFLKEFLDMMGGSVN